MAGGTGHGRQRLAAEARALITGAVCDPMGRPRFKAFVSYSHSDDAVARKLHRRLESYRPPRKVTAADGTPLQRLYPIFRDREELSTSADLSDGIRSALERSDSLIVICSPAAAASRWVNEEVKTFLTIAPVDRIHLVIAAGTPPLCYPPALAAVQREHIGADLRDGMDGFDDGTLKLIAGLMGAEFASLKNREAARQRRRTWIFGGLSVTFAALALIASLSAWRAIEETQRAEAELSRSEAAIFVAVRGVEQIVDQVSTGALDGSIPTVLADRLLGTAEAMIGGVVALGPQNPVLRREQGALLLQFARHYRRSGSTERFVAAAASAVDLFSGLSATRPGDPELALWMVRALTARGESAVAAGNAGAAQRDYDAALAIARPLAAADPADVERARALHDALVKAGGHLQAMGNLDASQSAFEEGLTISRGLASRQDADPAWIRDATRSLNSIGDIRILQGDVYAALAVYEMSLELAQEISARDPGHAEWTRAVLRGLIRVGDTRLTLSDPESALDLYEESVVVARDLVARDPENRLQIVDLALSLNRTGDAREALGDDEAALAVWQEAIGLLRRLVVEDETNAAAAKNLATSLSNFGAALVARGQEEAAHAALDEAVSLLQRLAAEDPLNAAVGRALYGTLIRIGDAGQGADSFAAYRDANAIIEDLARREPGDVVVARDLFVSYWRLARMADGDKGDAWAKVVNQLEDMRARGLLRPPDERFLAKARGELDAARARQVGR